MCSLGGVQLGWRAEYGAAGGGVTCRTIHKITHPLGQIFKFVPSIAGSMLTLSDVCMSDRDALFRVVCLSCDWHSRLKKTAVGVVLMFVYVFLRVSMYVLAFGTI